jgi:hypothetical protein
MTICRRLRAIIHCGNVGPDFVGVSGDGGLGRGRTLMRRERPRFYIAYDLAEMKSR